MKRRNSRRILRIRNEMRLWLRTHYGHRLSYTQREIDNGREELGFNGADDAFVAYSFFGADLAPTLSDGLDLTIIAEDLSELLAASDGGVAIAIDFLGDN